jgi:hypothetical protein
MKHAVSIPGNLWQEVRTVMSGLNASHLIQEGCVRLQGVAGVPADGHLLARHVEETPYRIRSLGRRLERNGGQGETS